MERTSLVFARRAPAGDWTGLARRLEQRFDERAATPQESRGAAFAAAAPTSVRHVHERSRVATPAASDHFSVQFMTPEGTVTETVGRYCL
jgi:hypothetical protein